MAPPGRRLRDGYSQCVEALHGKELRTVVGQTVEARLQRGEHLDNELSGPEHGVCPRFADLKWMERQTFPFEDLFHKRGKRLLGAEYPPPALPVTYFKTEEAHINIRDSSGPVTFIRGGRGYLINIIIVTKLYSIILP